MNCSMLRVRAIEARTRGRHAPPLHCDYHYGSAVRHGSFFQSCRSRGCRWSAASRLWAALHVWPPPGYSPSPDYRQSDEYGPPPNYGPPPAYEPLDDYSPPRDYGPPPKDRIAIGG